MRLLRTVLGLGLLALTATTAFGEARTLVTLDKGEPFEAMTFHADHLWVGQSRLDFNANYRVTIFDRADQKVGEVALRHSATFLYPYDATSVLVVGTAHTPNLTHYTIIRNAGGGRFTTDVRQIPMEAWANGWLGTLDGKEYLTDLSGNTNDPDRDDNPNLASQTIFTMQGGRARYLSYRMPMPIAGARVGRQFVVVHRYQIGHPASNVMVVDVDRNQARPLFAERRNMLTSLAPLASGLVAFSEQGTGEVLVVNPSTSAIVGSSPTKGAPRTLATVGHCVLAGNEQEKTVVALDVADPARPKPVLGLDFTTTGADLRGIRKIAVDPTTGKVYARSAYACNPMAEDCSGSSWNSVAVLQPTAATKLLAACVRRS